MTPEDLSVMMAENVSSVMLWVGSGILGGLSLFFAFLGIRKGFEFFRGLAGDRQSDRYWAAYQEDEKGYHADIAAGMSEEDADWKWFGPDN